MAIRSMVLRSSRTLPGQSCCSSAMRCGRRDLRRHRAGRPGEAAQEGARQRQDVLAPLAQRRHPHLHHVETVEEILAEAPRLDVGLEVPVGGGDDAHVAVTGARLADPLEVLLLQKTQQLALQRRRDLADLVEEQRPPLGHLDPAGLIADGAGERPLDVAEQLAGQQLLGQRRAVGDDERAGRRAGSGGGWRAPGCSCRCRSRR